jgi:hypothetical protein
MNLRSQKRKEYNVDLLLLQFDEEGDVVETTLDDDDEARTEAHYLFLTENLGWKEGLVDDAEEPPTPHDSIADTNNVNALATYLFLTEQMSWKKGQGAASGSTEIFDVPKGEKRRKNQGPWMCRWKITKGIHGQGRGDFTNCVARWSHHDMRHRCL